MEVHETEQARADLDEAIRLAPINAVYYDNRGLLLRRLGCYADASKDYLRARWIRSGKYRVHNGVVEALRGDDGSIDDMCTGDALVPLVNATGTTGATWFCSRADFLFSSTNQESTEKCVPSLLPDLLASRVMTAGRNDLSE